MCDRGSKSIEKRCSVQRRGAFFVSGKQFKYVGTEDCVLKKSNMTPWGRGRRHGLYQSEGSESFRKENISKNCVNVIDF
ncbi:hypothetical protein KR92_01710 [Bacillus sp. CN2]|nr:hypothetical protein BCBMB205_07010 [Bacillus velezensis]KFX40290.1 hypothetical protein KR92_01710 [Bacillus amyloliquefaciens]GFR57074.1 hypothetical protein KR92_01710 [Bacillus sp. CN2]AQZ74233.1 hypothetical protein BLL65_15070 [Bacillus velezensis]ARN88308.1 hypothetical protein AAV34_15430 [Bacillus velezensis]